MGAEGQFNAYIIHENLSECVSAIVVFYFNAIGATMTTTAEALSAQAAQLPPAEQMEVVERILDSLDQPDAALDALWAKQA